MSGVGFYSQELYHNTNLYVISTKRIRTIPFEIVSLGDRVTTEVFNQFPQVCKTVFSVHTNTQSGGVVRHWLH